MALDEISSGLSSLTEKLGLTNELTILERAWDHECGAFQGRARLAAIDRKAIVVEVQSSAAFHDLMLRRRELVRRLNGYFPKPWIHSMMLKMMA